jgi:ubiquinone/menaquinone biosynthesis C-methylase UbiE
MTEKHIKNYWEENSKYYQEDSDIKIGIHYGPGAPFESKLKLLGNLRGKKVLEIGCGGAQCGISMAKQGAIVTGIDQSEEQLKFAKNLAEKNKVKIKFVQGSFQDLKKLKSNTYDIAFSAFAFQYSPSLLKLFKQIYRILKKGGIFVYSLDHPFFKVINPKTLKAQTSYFKTGRYVEKNKEGIDFVGYNHTVSELFDPLVEAGFIVEKIAEPDSRIKYKGDPWYGLWGLYTPKLLKIVPPTIIFKARKK